MWEQGNAETHFRAVPALPPPHVTSAEAVLLQWGSGDQGKNLPRTRNEDEEKKPWS